MTLHRSIILGTLAAALALGPSLAQAGHDKHHHKDKGEHRQVLQEAANALQSTNPGLAQRLNAISERKQREQEEWARKKEEMRRNAEGDVQVIREASDALKESNPKLSRQLAKKADKKEQWMEKHERRKDRRGDRADGRENEGNFGSGRSGY